MKQTIIPKDLIAEIIDRTDIVSLISQYLPLKKRGNNHICCCPFHHEKTPSFTVNQSKQFYHCFGCGAHGNAISFLREHLGMSFIDSVKKLAIDTGIQLPSGEQDNAIPPESRLLKKCIRHFHQQLLNHKQALKYLHQRGLSIDTIKLFEIGYAYANIDTLKKLSNETNTLELLEKAGLIVKNTDSGDYYPRFRNRIIFPIYDQSNIAIGLGGRSIGEQMPKYLNSPQSNLFDKSQTLYNLNRIKKSKTPTSKGIIVVEGYMDVIALHEHGFPNTVAAMGTSVTRKQIQKLMSFHKKVAFCFDGDRAGRTAAKRTFENLLPELHDQSNVYFVFLPDQLDPDDILRQHGSGKIKTIFMQSLELDELLMQLIRPSHRSDDLSNQIQLYNQAQQYIKKIKSPIIKQLLEAKIRKHLDIKQQPPPNKAHDPIQPKKTLDLNTTVCQILIKYPEHLASIDNQLLKWLHTCTQDDTILKLINYIQTNPNHTPGKILQNVDAKILQQKQQFHNIETSLDELKDTIIQLIKNNLQSRISELAQKKEIDKYSKDLKCYLEIKQKIIAY